jgi:hypothetical protein
MNRKLTARERWFMTVLPATVVLAIYGFGVYRPQQADLADAQRRLGQARQDGVTQGQVAAKRLAARSLQDRVDAAKHEPWGNPSGSQVRAAKGLMVFGEAMALEKITDVFKQRSILVVASTRGSDSDARNVMPAGFAEAIKSIPGLTTGIGHGGVWRMEMVGSFGDLRVSLTAIEALDVLVVPLCVSMEPSQDNGPLHHWSLWVWM